MRSGLLGTNAGWLAFFNGSTDAESDLANGHRSKIARPMLLLLFVTAALVLGADILVYGRALGFGLVVFVAITGTAGLIVRRVLIQRSDRPRLAGVVLIAGMLPALEYVQALSMMFFVSAIVIFVALINGGTAKFGTRIWHVCKYWLAQVVRDTPEVRHQLASLSSGGFDWKRFSAGLILPVSIGLIFFGLFLSANPVLEAVIIALNPLGLVTGISPQQVGFWIISFVLVWPVLRFVTIDLSQAKPSMHLVALSRQTAPFLTKAAVRQTLILCNVLFLVQGVTDIGYLLAGAALPNGMTYAQYAHRGAYPLLATAMLAGGFSVATVGFAKQDNVIRFLTVLWMLQTMALVGSSVFRLSLYIDAYGLTLLRSWAAIWMGLIWVGICLVLIQIWTGRSQVWLVKCNVLLGVATLYLCCFFNFTHFVATYNFTNLDKETATEYACTLGPHAAPALWQTLGAEGLESCLSETLLGSPGNDWRERSFRTARLNASLKDTKDQLKNELPDLLNWRYGAVNKAKDGWSID